MRKPSQWASRSFTGHEWSLLVRRFSDPLNYRELERQSICSFLVWPGCRMYVGFPTSSSPTPCYLYPFTPTHSTGTNTPDPHLRIIYTNPQSRLLQRPLDGRKIHHHVTPVPDQHSIIHHGVPKFPASTSSMSREGPMLIEMTRLSTDTLGISISLQIKLYLPPAAEIGDIYDSFAWTLNAPI